MPVLVAASLLASMACAAAPAEPPIAPHDPARFSGLGVVMKTEVNPAFSKLSLLLFHDADEEVDPTALPATAAALTRAAGKLVTWVDAPGESQEGKSVFHAYAASLKADATLLEDALASGHRDAAVNAFETLRKRCESCHHFFRYDEAAK